MNAVFDLKRWFLYLGKHWNENKRRYLLSLAAIGGLLVLWCSFLMIVNPENPMGLRIQVVTYYAGLFLTGCLFASTIFNDLSEAPKGIHFLLTPASALEKLLTTIVFGVILFFISYTLVFYVFDVIMLKVSNGVMASWLEQHHKAARPPQDLLNVFVPDDSAKEFLFYIMLIFFAVQSIFLLGSVYFVKFQYIKTLVSGLVVFLILVFFVHKVLGSFMPDGSFFEPFTVYKVWNTAQGDVMILLPEWFSNILLFLAKYALAPCLWVVAYFRLKEKEV
ncbi:hypothetical protein A4H97_20495 [Niastella yeongjuensis]|uniref:Uncharacterized protein n=1 Tax=Niastella yeongjuensis TaxID=354355 RepID=A0A1V9FC57_9BACT|nr:hypothetical protein [Niastella yeongjuensis]OQP55969.1 hypothetical protein A4H97_20495 [Niastella yeongjuensis]SEP25987.1 hypothetical protein SAMN05660816_04977 [Niastella yeongjuensis]